MPAGNRMAIAQTAGPFYRTRSRTGAEWRIAILGFVAGHAPPRLRSPLVTTGLHRALVAAILVACLLFFFRDAIATGLTRLYGDTYDGIIEVAILNHWYNVFVHGEPWNLTGWFAPFTDTLGYNDSNIVPGIFFALARIAGADPFLATFAAHVMMKAIGFLGMYALLRRGLALDMALALAGAAIFTTANASLLHMYHAQLLAVGLMPWLMLLGIATVTAALADERPALWRNGSGFALLFGLSALNAFYQVWFFCVFMLVFVPAGLAFAGRAQRRALLAAAQRHRAPLACIALIGAVASLPFLIVYLPKLHESGGHSAAEMRTYLPILSDYVNTGRGNLVWGRLPVDRLRQGEYRFGFPVALLALAIVAGFHCNRHRDARWMRALGLSLLILFLAITRWSAHGSLWNWLYPLIPGSAGVRVITRFLLFLLIPMIALVMLLLQRWRLRPVLLGMLLAFLLLEQVQTRAPLMLDRPAQMAMLAAVGAPPTTCDAFFVISAYPDPAALLPEAQRVIEMWGGNDGPGLLERYRHNVDAMLISTYYRRPTINGFSTFNPPDWNFEHPQAPDYIARINTYVARHPVGRLCGLDMRNTPHWFPAD